VNSRRALAPARQIWHKADDRRQESLVPGATPTPAELLARLVAFDTASARSNLPLIAFVEDYLGSHGVAARRLPSEDGSKASLFATIGPSGTGGIGLSGHTDVVPVEGQTWSSDPFTVVERSGRLYGRGTCDMKGFLACVLAAVPMFAARRLAEPVHLVFSYDEEVGCTGVRPLIAELGRSLPKPRLVIVGEPTSMQPVDAHKGIHAFETRVTGREAHSSMTHLGVNAIVCAAQMIVELDRIAADMRSRRDGPRFEPPWTTVHVGRIEGGVQRNIVPRHCAFVWEFRRVPATDPEKIPRRLDAFARERLLPAMRAVAPDADIVTRETNQVPALEEGTGSGALSLALALAGRNEAGAVSYGTEAGLFALAGCPAVVCGPGDIAQAHAADEFIDAAQLDACMHFLGRLADRLAA
jgi:acetylornithine deacetylase